MLVFDEVSDESSIFVVDLFFVFSKTNPRAVDNGDVFTHVLYIFDGTDSVFVKVKLQSISFLSNLYLTCGAIGTGSPSPSKSAA